MKAPLLDSLLQLVTLPQASAEKANAGIGAAARKEPMKQRTPRVDWAELLSRHCRHPRKVRWSDCCEWCVTGCCACWKKEGPCRRKGPRMRSKGTKRTRCSSGCAGRKWR